MHARTEADGGEDVSDDAGGVLDESSPREPKDEPPGCLEPVGADRIIIEQQLVASAIELDSDLQIRIGKIDPIAMSSHTHLVLVDRLG
jgi:hypothetical protein